VTSALELSYFEPRIRLKVHSFVYGRAIDIAGLEQSRHGGRLWRSPRPATGYNPPRQRLVDSVSFHSSAIANPAAYGVGGVS